MKNRHGSARRRTRAVVVGAAAAGVLLVALAARGAAPARWGSNGHRMAARAALDGLPQEMPAFFRSAAPQLVYLSPEPDRWRGGNLRAMDEAWKYDHYIDLENVPPGALDAPDRFVFLERLYAAGIREPQRNVGFLPYRILEVYQRLASGFARWRAASDPSERAWIEARILNDAGILGHYAVDAAQPHHTTIHFNGWADGAPNPRGFSTDRELHYRFETAFVDAHLTPSDVEARLPPGARRLSDVRQAIWSYIRASNRTVEQLYELEQRIGFDPDAPPSDETRGFVAERLATGAEMLRALWWTAWLESEHLTHRPR